MRAEIISVGTELLIGSILNTNQQYLARACVALGFDVYHLSTVGDNPGRLAEALSEALFRSDLVVTTGGLGPTADDVTLRTAAGALGLELVRHAPTDRAIRAILGRKRARLTAAVAGQALVPRGSVVFPNRFGTAPGILTPVRGARPGVCTKYLLLLPGPPREMNPMFERYVRPRLAALGGGARSVLVTRSLKFHNIPEAAVAQRVDDLLRRRPPVTLGVYARPGEVELKIMSKHRSRRLALRGAGPVEREIRRRFPGETVLADEETLEARLGKLLRRRRATLGLAESCTGGLVGEMVTRVAGSSDYFTGSVVAYANRVKTALLGVPEGLLRRRGAVSAPVAARMAEGVRAVLGSGWGVAVTGIAGPSGGSPAKPVGLVFVAASGPGAAGVRRFFFIGGREEIRLKAAKAALKLAIDLLETRHVSRRQRREPQRHVRI